MILFNKKIKPFIIGVCGRSCSGKSTVVILLLKNWKKNIRVNFCTYVKINSSK